MTFLRYNGHFGIAKELQAAAMSAFQAVPAEPGAAAVSGGVGAGEGSRRALPPG